MSTKTATTTTLKDEVARIIKYNDEMALKSKAPPYTQRSNMTLSEVLDLPFLVLSLPLVGFLALLSGPLRARKQKTNPKQPIAKTLHLHIGYAIFRRVVTRFSPLQIQALTPSTTLAYKLHIWAHWIQNRTVDLGDGAKGHWLGNPNAKNVLLWIHGGGFAVPANKGHFTFFHKLLKEMQAAGKEMAVFFVAYTLAPKAVYPTQLRQSVAAARYLFEQQPDVRRKASNVYVGGDSAGGNLALALLSHIMHPHPEIEPLKLPVGGKLGGLTLISPWSSLEIFFPPMEMECYADLVDPRCAQPWAGSYLADRKRDNYTDPRLAPADWWRKSPVKHVLITGGGYEVMLPLIEDFALKFKESVEADGETTVEYFVGPGEAHVAAMFNILLGDNTETEQGKRVKAFYREVVDNN